MDVNISRGSSVEFFLVETVQQLEDARIKMENEDGRCGVLRRTQKHTETEGACQTFFHRIVADNYPNNADKTDSNYSYYGRLSPACPTTSTQVIEATPTLHRGSST